MRTAASDPGGEHLEFRVLGPVQVDALWGERAPAAAVNALQVQVHGLRRRLAAERIERDGPGYRLRLEPGELDLEGFELLADRGHRAVGRQRSAPAQPAGLRGPGHPQLPSAARGLAGKVVHAGHRPQGQRPLPAPPVPARPDTLPVRRGPDREEERMIPSAAVGAVIAIVLSERLVEPAAEQTAAELAYQLVAGAGTLNKDLRGERAKGTALTGSEIDAYTVASREDALDFMADYPGYGEQRWYTNAVAAAQVSFSWRRMPPGTGGRGSYGHRHPGQEEVYFVISGVVTFKINDDVIEAGPQTAVRIGGDAFRSVHNDTGDEAQLLIFSPRLDEPPTETTDDFWGSP